MDKNLRLSLDLLRGFRAAARHLSFTRAARELFVTQSAISREIKKLEEQIVQPLFHRVNRALQLTHAGEELYRAADEALALIDTATERLEIFPVCSPALARDKTRPPRTPADLAGHVLLDFEAVLYGRSWYDWEQWFDAMKIRKGTRAGTLRFSHYDQVTVDAFVAWLRNEVRRDEELTLQSTRTATRSRKQ